MDGAAPITPGSGGTPTASAALLGLPLPAARCIDARYEKT